MEQPQYYSKIMAVYYIISLLAIIVLSIYFKDGWLLIGAVVLIFSGTLPQLAILFIIFCIGYWIKKGFSFEQHVTFFACCAVWAALCCEVIEIVIKRGLKNKDKL